MRVIIALVFVAIFYVIYRGSVLIQQDAEVCASSGGVQVRTYDGFACIQQGAIK